MGSSKLTHPALAATVVSLMQACFFGHLANTAKIGVKQFLSKKAGKSLVPAVLALTVFSAQTQYIASGCMLFPTEEAINNHGTAIYYVSTALGDNANSGTSMRAPLKTIEKANEKLSAGDTCIVLPGVYDERFYVDKSGQAGAPIVYMALGEVICRGFTVQADYIHIAGFEITDTIDDDKDGTGLYLKGKFIEARDNDIHDVTRQGVLLDADEADSPLTSDCVIRNNRISRAGHSGIWLHGRNHLIEKNDISRILQHPPKWENPPEWADADGMVFLGSGHIIRKNHIHDIHATDPENSNDPHIDIFQTPGGPAYDIIIEQNVASVPIYPGRCMQIAMISASKGNVRNLIFRNNVFLNTCRGLNIWGHGNTITGVVVANNTWVNFEDHAVELHQVSGAKVVNNIFYNIARSYMFVADDSREGLSAEHNCIYNGGRSLPKDEKRLTDLWGVDPMFVDAAGNNFDLQPDSPMIDAGIKLDEVVNDFRGTPRPQGRSHDIGAYEILLHRPKP